VHNTHLQSRRNNSGGISENETKGVSHSGLAIYIEKYLKAKEEKELWKIQISHNAKI
jgi:hypothetical protein